MGVGFLRLVIYFYSNSSGMFVSASQDKSGTLDVIEEKIARATMLPRTHGEVLFSVSSVA